MAEAGGLKRLSALPFAVYMAGIWKLMDIYFQKLGNISISVAVNGKIW